MKQNIRGEDKLVAISRVSPNKFNPKEAIEDNADNKARYEEIYNEIKERGLYQAITVREISKDKYEIIDGYHRYRACKELGFMDIRVNNLGEITDEEAKIININLERLKVPMSEVMLASNIADLARYIKLEDLSSSLHMDNDKVEEYIGLTNFDWSEFDKQESIPEESEKKMTCPHCGEEISL